MRVPISTGYLPTETSLTMSSRMPAYTIADVPETGRYYVHSPDIGREALANFTYTLSSKPKITLIGDANIGKTTLLNCMYTNTFGEQYKATVGTSFQAIGCEMNGNQVAVAFWDTAGSETHNAMTDQFYRNSDIVCICFALDDPQSFASTESWLGRVRELCPPDTMIFLVGCKSDLPHRVGAADIEQKAKAFKMEYFETSSKNFTNIAELFKRLCFLVVITKCRKATATNKKTEIAQSVNINQREAKKKEKCCK